MTQIIKLSQKFYSKESIEESIKEFSNVLTGKIIDAEFTIELNINEDYDSENVIDEFKNYALSLMKNNKEFLNKSCQCPSLKTDYNKKPNKFEFEGTEYFYNFYRSKKLEEGYLVTNEAGSHIFLNNEDYNSLKTKEFNQNQKELIEKLVEVKILFKEGGFSDLANQKANKLSFLFQGPSLHIVVVTLRCNLKCVYCHASSVPMRKEGYDMQIKEARKTVDKIFESPSKNITIEFQGGEPLLNYEVIKFIVNYAKAKNEIAKKELNFALVSNLVYMTDEILDFIIKNNIGLCTSVDGHKAIHNVNRQEYDKTTDWVRKVQQKYEEIKDEKELRVNALPTITKQSLQYPKELVDEYIDLKLKSIFLRQLNPLGSAKENQSNIFYEHDKYIEFWKEVLDYIIEKNKEGIYLEEYFTKLVLKKIFENVDPNHCELRNPCGAATGQLLYNYNGTIYSCDEGRMLGNDMFKVGTIDDSYKQIMTNPTTCGIIASSITDTQNCDKCVYKPYCGICPIINYSTGNSTVTNIPSQSRCKILKSQFGYVFDKIQNDKQALEVFNRWLKED